MQFLPFMLRDVRPVAFTAAPLGLVARMRPAAELANPRAGIVRAPMATRQGL
jgi:hypothetical protein